MFTANDAAPPATFRVSRGPAESIRLRLPRMLTRRQFILGSGAGLVLGGAGYARFLEPRWLKITRPTVPLVGPPGAAPLRILHLSDLHLSSEVPLAFIDEAIHRGLAEKPDLIAITGDFTTGRLAKIDAYAGVLAQLSAAAPTFACLGNHDGGPWARWPGALEGPDRVMELLRRANIACLQNECREVRIGERAVQLIGVGDLWNGMCVPAMAFRAAPARGSALRVVLNHNPDAKTLLQPYDWDLMLSGHTHGGQVRIPLVGTPFAPVEDKRYVAGLYAWEQRWLHVSCGVGNLHGVRLNCRPELSLLTVG